MPGVEPQVLGHAAPDSEKYAPKTRKKTRARVKGGHLYCLPVLAAKFIYGRLPLPPWAGDKAVYALRFPRPVLGSTWTRCCSHGMGPASNIHTHKRLRTPRAPLRPHALAPAQRPPQSAHPPAVRSSGWILLERGRPPRGTPGAPGPSPSARRRGTKKARRLDATRSQEHATGLSTRGLALTHHPFATHTHTHRWREAKSVTPKPCARRPEPAQGQTAAAKTEGASVCTTPALKM